MPEEYVDALKAAKIPKKKKDAELRDMYKSGPKKDMDAQEWGKLRLCAIGSAAVFFAYGPTGWWTCFTDQNKYNQKSIWGTVNVAEMRMKHMLATADERRADDPFHTNHPWQNIERLMYSCLANLQIHRVTADDTPLPSLDWLAIQHSWNEKLTEK
jgi:hypothetical protein